MEEKKIRKRSATTETTGSISRRVFLKTAGSIAAASSLVGVLPGQASPSATDPIYLTDMSRCSPAGALSRKSARRHWRLLDYETETFKGTMLVAGRNTGAPEIRYPLQRKGWYAISVGVLSYGPDEEATRLQVRLGRDPTFSLIRHKQGEENQIDDYYWRTVELQDQDELVFQQLCRQLVPEDPDSVGNTCRGAWLAYIKLVPLTDEQVNTLKIDRKQGDTRTLFCHHDAWSYTWSHRATTEAEIRREIEPLRDTDFIRLYWEAGSGDRLNYPTKVGKLTPADDGIDDPYRVGDRLAKETWIIWREKGIDPLRTAANYAHELGLEFHATYRTSGFHYPVPHDEWNEGGAYDQHPEWRGRDKLGRSTPRLSYAYQGVRDLVITFLKEMATYPVDGICLAYNRRPPYLEYEQPLIDGFSSKFGKDPRQLDSKDPQWLDYRASYMTRFMTELRQGLSEVQARTKREKPFGVSAIVLSSKEENLYYGLDLEKWVNQGLVDTIIPYSSAPNIISSKDAWTDPKSAEYFYRITRGTNCKMALNLMPRELSPDEYRRRAHSLYQAGSEHFFFWDHDARNDFSPSWETLRRLGHRKELEEWAKKGMPEHEFQNSQLTKLGDWDLSYATPG